MTEGCPSCGGTGFEVRMRPDGVSSAVACACRRRDRGDRLLRAARIPRRYDHCTLEEFKASHPSLEKALGVARDWVDRWPLVGHATSRGGGLLFVGPPGTGKTHLAVGVARQLIGDKGAQVLFCEQREFFKALQGTYDRGAPATEAEVLGPVMETEVLILDDLGAGRMTEWNRDVLHDVIVHRYNETLPLIVTSNRPVEEQPAGRAHAETLRLSLRDRLGDALISRIYEMCLIVPFEGIDFRRDILQAKHHF